jgi:hypothetical protein
MLKAGLKNWPVRGITVQFSGGRMAVRSREKPKAKCNPASIAEPAGGPRGEGARETFPSGI